MSLPCRLKALASVPGGYVAAARADGKSHQVVVITRAQFNAQNARAAELEQYEAARARNKQILADAAREIAVHKADRARAAARAAEAKAEREIEAKRIGAKRKENAAVSAYLAIARTHWRMPAPAQASVQAAPVAAPVEPLEPILSRHEITSLAEAERQTQLAVEAARPKYDFRLIPDWSSIEPSAPALAFDRKAKLKF